MQEEKLDTFELVLTLLSLRCDGTTTYLLGDLFNKKANNGAEMEKYSALLKSVVNEISRLFKKRNFQTLSNNCNAQLIPKEKQTVETNPFESVTWLVIK